MEFVKLKAAFAYCKAIFERCLVEPDVNSRLVFLLSGVGTIVALGIVTVAFVFAKNKDAYPSMILALSGGAVGHSIGRYFTKKNSTAPTSDGATPVDVPAEIGAK
jgi:hypothetical protein